jgi:hypothetical protein
VVPGAQRGLYSQPSDANGQQLMVPAQDSKILPRRLGSRPASAGGYVAASAGPARRVAQSSNGGNLGALGQKQQSVRSPGMLQQGAVDAGAAADQQGLGQNPKRSMVQCAAADAGSQGMQQHGLISAVGSQPTTPKVIDNALKAGAAAIPAPWLI